MDYALGMRTKLYSVSFGIIFIFAAAFCLRADEVEMQNGDRYFGKVLSVSADSVEMESEVLGKINVPRKSVANLSFGAKAVAPKTAASATPVSAPTNLPAAASSAILADTNLDLPAAIRNPGAGTNVMRQIREQMLAGSPEATAKFDDMVGGLLSGRLNMDDLRREARSDAEQLRALKRDLGPEAGSSLDGYLEVLDNFLDETNSAAAPTNAAAVPQTKEQVH
jgi:hypothetical protein